MKAKAIEHLEELRARIIIVAAFFSFAFILGMALSPVIIQKIISDMSISNITLVSLTPLEFIHTQLKIGFFSALLISSPMIIYQLIAFIKPGAKRTELAAVKYTLPSIFVFFISGAAFGYIIFTKIALRFLAHLSSLADIQNMWSLNTFISFILISSVSLGILFELPVVLLLLKYLNLVNEKILSRKRKHVYVSIFILAAIITPPDVITQVMISLPVILLYEVSLAIIKFL